jgi:hypothetical protein
LLLLSWQQTLIHFDSYLCCVAIGTLFCTVQPQRLHSM